MAKKRFRLFFHYRSEYVDNAKRRGIEWRLTDEEFLAVASLRCHYCGSPPRRFTRNRWSNRKAIGAVESEEVLNGIDRLNPEKGYVLSNCVACCSKCNRAKMDMGVNELLEHVKQIFSNLVK